MILKQNSLIALLLISFLPVIIFLLNPSIAQTLWQYSFDDGTYSHAFLIPVIYLFLCYHLYIEKSLYLRSKINWVITSLFIFSCYAFFVSSVAQISLVYWITHVLIIVTSTLMLFKYHWRIIFPPLYLIFMYPLWGPLVLLLQEVSIVAVSFLMSLTGIPTYVDKQFVSIPEGTFEIANGCSGLRYFITALAISSLYIFLYLKKYKDILAFLSLAIAGSLIVNWIRITIIILVGHYTNMTSSLIDDHNMFGWYIFIPFMFLLFIFGNTLGNDKATNKTEIKQHPILLNRTVFSICIVIVGIFLSSTYFHYLIKPVRENTRTSDQINTDIFPTISNYSQLLITEKKYKDSGFIVHNYQFDGRDLDSKPTFYNNKLINNGWELLKEEFDNRWNYQIMTKKNQKSLIAVSYEIDGLRETSTFRFKLLRLKKALLGNSQSRLNWIGTICISDCMDEKKLIMQLSLLKD